MQTLSREVTREVEDNLEFKNYAFENGIFTADIGFVMSIYLRNKALKKLGFKIKDLD